MKSTQEVVLNQCVIIGGIYVQKILGKYFFGKDIVVVKNILATFSIKGIALIVSFLSLPAYIIYLDNQMVLGVWFTLLSILTWLLTFDFGIGNGLRNKLVEALVDDKFLDIKRKISSSYFIIGIITVIFFVLGFLIITNLNFSNIFNIPATIVSQERLGLVVLITFISICLQFFLRTINFILYSLQLAALNSLSLLITSVSQYLFILFAPSFGLETDLLMLAFSSLVFTNLPLIILSIYVFWGRLKTSKPSLKYVNKNDMKEITSLGGIFFWNQIMYTAIIQSNLFIITRIVGPSSVVEYEIYYKLFMVLGIFVSIAISPIWSAITKSYNEKDYQWIKKYFGILSIIVLICLIIQLLIALLSPFLFEIWLGNKFENVNYNYALLFAIYGSVFIFQSIVSTFACGLGKMRLQSICYTIALVVKISLLLLFSAKIDNWSMVLIIDILVLFPYCVMEWREIKKYVNNSILSNI